MSKNWLIKNINNKYFLKVGNHVFKCEIGEGGLQRAVKKNEGDKTTPLGNWHFETIYYRSDRVFRPKFKKKNILKVNRITENCCWCDDITSKKYNKYVKINDFQQAKFNYERLWREDEAYDVVIVTSHNIYPTIKNKGSAIFIHCSFSDNRKTSGCIALNKKDLVFLLNNLKNKVCIKI